MHLSLSSLEAHLLGAFRRGRQGIDEVVHDVVQAARNLEAKAQADGDLFSLFTSHGGTLEDAKALVERFETHAAAALAIAEREAKEVAAKLLGDPPAPPSPSPAPVGLTDGSTVDSSQAVADPEAGGGEGQQGGEGQ